MLVSLRTWKSSFVPVLDFPQVATPISDLTTKIGTKQYAEARIVSNEMSLKKKKKKLRPSFREQTLERWSIKISSQRNKFPWQKQMRQSEGEESGDEEEEYEVEIDADVGKGESLLENAPRTPNSAVPKDSESLGKLWTPKAASFPFQNAQNAAPWIHGSRRKTNHLDARNKFGNIESEKKENAEIYELGEETSIENLGGNLVDVQLGRGFNFKQDDSASSEDDNGDSMTTSSIIRRLKEMDLDEKSSSLDEKISDSNGDAANFSFPLGRRGDMQSDDCKENGGNFIGRFDDSVPLQSPWQREKYKSNAELAEKTIPEPELRRLRNIALRMKERMTVGAAGITQELAGEIHERWKEVEVVKFKFEGPLACNMIRTHDMLERKTGGLVIWRSGGSVALYRGMAYKLCCVQSYTKSSQATHVHVQQNQHRQNPNSDAETAVKSSASSMLTFDDPYNEFNDLINVDSMLDQLGPRFLNWSGYDPLPVDADLLPGLVCGYKPPLRFLPYGIKKSLKNREMTALRRLARTVPPHFALGRNRHLQGLAQAIVKLWEKSVVAKIAIKRGVFNTCNARMAEEIKNLTGGTLLSRNKEYIVIYRGNDFLSPAMKEALSERQKLAKLRQDEEEQARLKAADCLVIRDKMVGSPFVAGTLAETMEARSRWGNEPSSEEVEMMKRDEAVAKHASLVRYLEIKLNKAQQKVRKAEKSLLKVQAFLDPAELPTDLETVTDEERFLFRKMGLSMKPYLLLGRRGVFDGTIENIHLHWKFKELVKIIVKRKSFPQVKHIAISLEAESGGLLISLDKTSKGYAIILYRGKNYQRPQTMRPKNLLTKRQALARAIELQRREALKHHISFLRERIEMLKSELEQMEASKETNDGDLYSRLAKTYASDDDLEEEGEEAYLETYNSDNEIESSMGLEVAS